MPGSIVSSWGGWSHAWWHHVTLDGAMPGGTVSPWGRLSCAGGHHITLGRTRPCLVASRSFGDRHLQGQLDCAWWTCVTLGKIWPCRVPPCHPRSCHA